MPNVLATLPLQLALQLVTPGNHSLGNANLSTDLQLVKQPMAIPRGYTAFPDVGVAMKYYTNNLTWNMARKHCITEGGNLAVIDSIEKSEHANILRQSNPRGAFLGIHKLFDGAEWVSVKTGLPIAFIPWKQGVDRGPATPSCTVLWGEDGGRVGPGDCNTSWTYTCEVPLFRN